MFFGLNSKMWAVAAVATTGGLSLPVDSASAQGVSVQVSCGRSFVGTDFQGYENCSGNGSYFSNNYPFNYTPGDTVGAALSSEGAGIDTYQAGVKARANFGLVGLATYSAFQNLQLQGNGYVDTWSVGTTGFASWEDYFTFLAPGLNVGDSVRVRLTQIIDMHDNHASVTAPTSGAQSYLYSNIFTSSGFVRYACGEQAVNPGGLFCHDINGYPTDALVVGRNTFTYEFDLLNGYNNRIGSSLSSLSSVSGRAFYSTISGGEAAADALNTAYTYLTVLTPGASLVSASGHNYALPVVGGVPEPASWAFMLAGFGIIGFTLRTRAKPITA
jgi:hypothetical protein